MADYAEAGAWRMSLAQRVIKQVGLQGSLCPGSISRLWS